MGKKTKRWHIGMLRIFAITAALLIQQGCTGTILPSITEATLTPRSSMYYDLIALPKPKGQIIAAVYNFRDQSGQYKAAPSSSFSTAVTQGATSILNKVLYDSGWFITLEREGLQNLLTERKIIRAANKNNEEISSLLSSNILFEGSIISYDSNVKTGGAGVRYLGVGTDEKYIEDQVTINLRTIDIRTGHILTNVMTTKTILSKQVNAGVYKFVEYKELLEAEAGYTRNEPKHMCVQSAIELAVMHTIAKGIKNNIWGLSNEEDKNNEILTKYYDDIPLVVIKEEFPSWETDSYEGIDNFYGDY